MTTEAAAAQGADYYVYVYRDPETRVVRYVGKGQDLRVEKHLKRSHNAELREWIERLKRSRKLAPIVEIVPCASETEAFAIEAALISALWKGRGDTTDRLFNRVRGHHGRFAPLGLPPALADRRYDTPLTRDDLARLGGALVVIVGTKDFDDDGRTGTRPRLTLSDSEVQDRIRMWWQIGRHVDRWQTDAHSAPRLVVGVTGPPRGRWVWGASLINHRAWGNPDHGLWQVPVSSRSVDASQLRGRIVAPGEVGPVGAPGERRFGGITAQFFDVVPSSATRPEVGRRAA